jgi:ABC-type multidrug transport system fused ATPase/permease subunit
MIRAIRERKGVCKVKTVNTYFKKHIGAVLLWVLFTLAVSFFAPLKSFQLKWLIDSTSKEEAIRYLFLVFGVTLASYVFESLSRRTFTNIACHAVQSVRNDVMERVLGRTMSDYDAEEDSVYISLLTTDIRTLYDDYYMAIFNIVFWGGIMLCALGLYFYISPLMLLVILVVSVPPLVLPRFMNARLKKARDAFSAEMASYTQHIKEYLGGFAVIRGFLREAEFSRRHREFSQENARKECQFQQSMNFIITTSSLMSNLIFAVVLLVGVFLVFDGKITMGTMSTAASMANFVISPCHQISQNYARLKASKGIRERLEQSMNPNPDQCEPENPAVAALNEIRHIDCKDLGFTYSGSQTPVLHAVDFHLKKQEKVALVGESGCGKSTFAKLLYQYYPSYTGHIFVNGQELNTLPKEALYKRVGYIAQNTFLFNDTIRNNICLYESFSDVQIQEAAQRAGIWDFIEALPDGLDTMVSENGKNLSGGQRQRIGIARLVIRRYEVILADEITASLDAETSEQVMENLLALPCTLVAITHDTASRFMQKFDAVYRVEHGVLAASL